MHKTISLILLAFVVLSCQNSNKKNNIDSPQNKSEKKSKIVKNEYFTTSGKQFIVTADYSQGSSICDIAIETNGFENRNSLHNIGPSDPIKEIFVADLDFNGFDEIYIITISAGSGSYGTVHGFGSNKDKSATPIYVPKPTKNQLEKGGIFEGYRGHDAFELANGILTNTFPIYNNSNTNSLNSGKSRTLSYSLIAGEAGWILRAEKIIQQ